MNGPHSCSDQPFDMAAVVFAAKRTILDSNAPIFADHSEGIAAELLRIVDLDRLRDSGRRPNQLIYRPRHLHRFPAHTKIETWGDRQDRWFIESDMKPKDDPARDINGTVR